MIAEQLATALLVATGLLVSASFALFTVRSGRRRGAGTGWMRGAAAATVVALATLALAAVSGAEPGSATGLAVVLGGSVLAWTPVARHWAVRGLVAWALSIDTAVLYLAYVAHWTATADLGPLGTLASVALVLLEAFVLLIGAGYVWEMVDVLARRTWSTSGLGDGTATPGRRPFVSIHVPTHNEPPDLVIGTLEALATLDYDDYEVLVVDNNTGDPALWRPVQAWCDGQARFRFLHLADWPGYKSGALNESLRVTDPRAELVGIVDADYIVEPDFLARCAPLFTDPDVAFVQTPQDYRDWDVSAYFRRLYRSYSYFFDVSQRSRAERNGAIFGGTMGLIRKAALEAVGGWDEWCITEDAELSLRLLRAGGRGVHVDSSFGRGIMPLTFEALKRQRFRWCFGGVQILRMHLRSLLPGRRTPENQLTLAQRWAYLVGGLQWFGDLASVMFTGFLALGALDVVLGHGVVVRRLSGLLLACAVVLVVLGALRSLALLRRTSGAGWRESVGALGIWLALGRTVAMASWRALVAREGVFLRTPKVRGEIGWRDAVRGNRVELLLGAACAAIAALALAQGSVAAVAVGALLLLHSLGYLAAPLNSVAAISSDLPDELRRRRREALVSWSSRSARRSGFVMVATAAVLTAFVGFAAPVQGPELPSVSDEMADFVEQHSEREVADREQHDPGRSTDGPASVATTAVVVEPSITPAGVPATDVPTVGESSRSAPQPSPTADPTSAPTSA
ncbi:glycosyltransferase, partial [Nocardioides sp.]